MKIDAHQHFWNYNPEEYSWINDSMQVLKRDFMPSHLKTELDRAGFDACIAVQARQTLEETRWLLSMASENDFIKGVVGWVDLCSENVEKQLQEFSKNPKFIGVRHVVHDEPDDNFMARPDFQRGISLLEKYGLIYDLLIFPKHLPLACKLVERFPNQQFILDHIAKPNIKERTLEPWKTNIEKLARFPNVACKISGMVTEADWAKWQYSDFEIYLNHVFQAFGPERLMIGSDWPVCTVAGTYTEVMNLAIKYLESFEKEIQEKILGFNCIKLYLSR